MLPLLNVMLVVQGYGEHEDTVMIVTIIKTMSVMVCFYGLLAMLKAASALLHEHGIHAKFWCIKGLIIVMLVPPIIVGFCQNSLPDTNEEYSKHTMVEAWSAVVSLPLLTGLSLVFLKNFKPEDALAALHNSENKRPLSCDQTEDEEEEKAIIADADDEQTNIVVLDQNN